MYFCNHLFSNLLVLVSRWEAVTDGGRPNSPLANSALCELARLIVYWNVHIYFSLLDITSYAY